jgi:hypothetical protein
MMMWLLPAGANPVSPHILVSQQIDAKFIRSSS